MTNPTCRGCGGQRTRSQYLCLTCWRALPAVTRGRLARRDTRALRRLRELHVALEGGMPLPIIRVSR